MRAQFTLAGSTARHARSARARQPVGWPWRQTGHPHRRCERAISKRVPWIPRARAPRAATPAHVQRRASARGDTLGAPTGPHKALSRAQGALVQLQPSHTPPCTLKMSVHSCWLRFMVSIVVLLRSRVGTTGARATRGWNRAQALSSHRSCHLVARFRNSSKGLAHS